MVLRDPEGRIGIEIGVETDGDRDLTINTADAVQIGEALLRRLLTIIRIVPIQVAAVDRLEDCCAIDIKRPM